MLRAIEASYDRISAFRMKRYLERLSFVRTSLFIRNKKLLKVHYWKFIQFGVAVVVLHGLAEGAC